MTGIKLVNLNFLVDEIGKDATKSYLSLYSCPSNADVEGFLKHKAIVSISGGKYEQIIAFAGTYGDVHGRD